MSFDIGKKSVNRLRGALTGAMRMLCFTTDDIPARDRFDHWREARGKGLFGVTIELERQRRADFYGRFMAMPYGGGLVSELRASSYRVSRTRQDIARASDDSLLVGWQVEGAGWLEAGERPSLHRVTGGSLAVAHSRQPYAGTPAETRGFLYRVIKIPLSGRGFTAPSLVEAAAAPIDAGSAFLRPMTALFAAIAGRDAPLSDPAAGIDAMARLALMAAGRLPHRDPENRAALRLALLQAARAILRRDMGRAGLSPVHVARELGISPRQLHILFEPSGLSFSRTLTLFRLKAAAHLLAAEPARSVAAIAYDCGFDSLATFYRAFRAAYAMAPMDMRLIGTQGNGGGKGHGFALSERTAGPAA